MIKNTNNLIRKLTSRATNLRLEQNSLKSKEALLMVRLARHCAGRPQDTDELIEYMLLLSRQGALADLQKETESIKEEVVRLEAMDSPAVQFFDRVLLAYRREAEALAVRVKALTQ